jgi:hypothetical protein
MDTGLFVFIIQRRNSCFVFEGLTSILRQFTAIYTEAVGLLHKGRLLEFLRLCGLKEMRYCEKCSGLQFLFHTLT